MRGENIFDEFIINLNGRIIKCRRTISAKKRYVASRQYPSRFEFDTCHDFESQYECLRLDGTFILCNQLHRLADGIVAR